MKLDKLWKKIATTVAVVAISSSAWAVPVLQLDILGGSYDTKSETIIGSGNAFSLYAYGKKDEVSLSNNYYLSIALLGVQQPGGNLGSFKVNGQTINATADMYYGTPPVEYLPSGTSTTKDSGDLAQHGVFPTYFSELAFNFSAGNQSGIYNTAEQTGAGPQSGSGMYYKLFDFDISGLSVGSILHFDLYNESLIQSKTCTTGKNKTCSYVLTDVDVNKFAPFSHDAQVSAVPLPAAVWLFGSALFGFVMVSNRRKV